ncbi:MAG TPA: TIM barrel protein [Candidatus Acidoferrum sp.]|nr:TIM barrel protein [Candidatus Acidoferrum sp.]
MKLGISSYTFGWAVGVRNSELAQPLDENGLLDRARDLCLKLLQIGDNLPLHTFDEARLARLAERAARERVQIEVGARRLVPERVAEYARIARRLNAKLIRFVIDDADFHPKPEEVTAILRDCAPMLDGLLLGIENHDRFNAATLRDMIERAGSERIGVCLDTANSLGAGEGIGTVAETLAPLVLNLHVKDFHIARVPHLMGFTVTGRPAGSGFLEVPRLLKQLSSARRCETAILELWTPPEPQLEDTIAKEAAWAAQSIQYLKPFFTL